MARREERMNELSQMSQKGVIHRILEYPDQDRLNQNPRFPAGQIARSIQDNGYRMTPKQRDALIRTFVDRTQTQVAAKEQELSQLSRRDLIDRICVYGDQTRLDYQADGEPRWFRYGETAQQIREHHYRMSERQQELLLRGFAELTATETLEMEQAHTPSPVPVKDPEPSLEEGQTFYYENGTKPQAIGKADTSYEQSYVFEIEGYAPNPEDRKEINRALQQTVEGGYWTEHEPLTGSLDQYLKEKMDGQSPKITSVSWELTDENQGVIHVISNGPMLRDGILHTEDWIDRQNGGPVTDCLMSFIDNNGIYSANPDRLGLNGLTKPIYHPFEEQHEISQAPDLSLTDADLAGLSDENAMEL